MAFNLQEIGNARQTGRKSESSILNLRIARGLIGTKSETEIRSRPSAVARPQVRLPLV